jgi:DNA topoisomerase-1
MPKKQIERKDNIFVPLSEDDVKHATEVLVKEKPVVETIEYIKPVRKAKASKKISKPASKKEYFAKSPVGQGYTLIITEKPAAAQKIAYALSSSARKLAESGVPYYELTRDNKKIVVACAVGHLFTLTQKEKRGTFPVFDLEWKPNYLVKKADFSKKYYTLLGSLVKGADDFIVASDFDTEGEVIGWNIIRFIAKQKDAKRMKYSTLTTQELQESYKQAHPTLEWGQAIAGESRHYLDWMYGINLSRALMNAIKTTGSFRLMSIGRVQGPALHLVVEKELEIQKFKPTPYWEVFLTVSPPKTILKYNKEITNKAELEKFKSLKGKIAEARTEKSEQRIPPLFPFDLTALQTEAYKFLGLTPAKTLQVAQKLYLAGLISYPRTSSQQIPDSIAPRKILEKLSQNFSETKFITRSKPIEGKKSDPAHPSIYPTGEYNELSGDELKLYNLIVQRFIACFCSDAIIDNKTIIVEINNLKFTAKGIKIREKGWMNVYKSAPKEQDLEDVNGKVKIDDVKIEEKMTQPPRRYSPASLVSELEKRNLGTKATRANIIETLYSRGYIKDTSIQATHLGMQLIETLGKYSPIIIDENLTRKFEQETEAILESKPNVNLLEKEQKIINEAKTVIKEIAGEMKEKEKEIGKELLAANNNMWQQQKKDNELIECPVCKRGKLSIMYSKKTRKSFIACNSFPACKTTFSLPPNSLIKKANKICDLCNFPKLLAIRKAKRPWEFCFNPKCESNKAWQEKREQANKEKENQEIDEQESEED